MLKKLINKFKKNNRNVIVEVIDGKQVSLFYLTDDAIEGNVLKLDKKTSYIIDENKIMYQGKFKIIHLIKDKPIAIDYTILKEVFNQKERKKVKPSMKFFQPDYNQIGLNKNIKNIDTKLLKKVLETKFISNMLEEGMNIPEWLIPLVSILNLIVTVYLALKISGVGI